MKGIKGEAGPTSVGERGDVGLPGPVGYPGIKGDRGPSGKF